MHQVRVRFLIRKEGTDMAPGAGPKLVSVLRLLHLHMKQSQSIVVGVRLAKQEDDQSVHCKLGPKP